MKTRARLLVCVAIAMLLANVTASIAAEATLPDQTFSNILTKYDTVVIARRKSVAIANKSGRKEWGHAKFQVIQQINGDMKSRDAAFDAPCRIEDGASELFMLAGIRYDEKNVVKWRLSQPVTKACREHILGVVDLKATGVERLAFFLPFLEHTDSQVSANAHLEFALAEDEPFAAVSSTLDRTKIRKWLDSPELTDEKLRLYLAMLARCGDTSDGDWLRKQLASNKHTTSLDARIGCYLALKGEEGLPFVERTYLSDKEIKSEGRFVTTYSAISALRYVHHQFTDTIPKERIVNSFRLILNIPNMADLIIPDLARMEDWDSLDRLVTLFKTAKEGHWSRLQVVNFVRA